MIKMIDSHAHLTSPDLAPHIEAMLKRAKEAGIEAIINICTDPDELERSLVLEKAFPWIYTVAATTPHDIAQDGERHFEAIASKARQGLLAGIGETGLDYHAHIATKEIQQPFLRRYFHLAMECHLPVVIHCRDAFEDFIRILDEEYQGPGVLHCFTGTLEDAKNLVKRGWYCSMSGVVTYKKSDALREIAKWIPLDHLLIETDTPYLAPQSHRGKTNEPAYIIETASCIAQIKGISLEDVAHATSANAKKLFSLDI